jgi:hypothetical protein
MPKKRLLKKNVLKNYLHCGALCLIHRVLVALVQLILGEAQIIIVPQKPKVLAVLVRERGNVINVVNLQKCPILTIDAVFYQGKKQS